MSELEAEGSVKTTYQLLMFEHLLCTEECPKHLTLF